MLPVILDSPPPAGISSLSHPNRQNRSVRDNISSNIFFTVNTSIQQILIYRSVLSPVSPLYYSVASNVGIGQSPRPTVYPHYNTNRQRKQYLCRNLIVADSRGRLSLRFCKNPYENQPNRCDFFVVKKTTRVEWLKRGNCR